MIGKKKVAELHSVFEMRKMMRELTDSTKRKNAIDELKRLEDRKLITRVLAIIGLILIAISSVLYIYEPRLVVFVILFIGLVIFTIGFLSFRAIVDAEHSIEKLNRQIRTHKLKIKLVETNETMSNENKRAHTEKRNVEIHKLEKKKKELEAWLSEKKKK